MKRWINSLAVILMTAAFAPAHFVWIVPDEKDAGKAQVIFSDDLEPDQAVAIDKIAGTKLLVRDGAKSAALDWKKGDHAYLLNVPAKGADMIGGVCSYGVIQRGEGKPFLLTYCAKWIRGDIKEATAWEELPLEIVPLASGKLKVLFGGKAAGGDEVVTLLPSGKKETVKTNEQGEFEIKSAAPGLYGIRARHIQAKAGEHEGKKYDESRHYATLVFQRGEGGVKKTGAEAVPASTDATVYAPLPKAVSSFGAAVADGWLYVYGGHAGRTHQYSTESVRGTFHRLKLSNPRSWEELPGGPPSQGLALVAHQGKIYRIGGMQPRNKPGDPADTHSLATCARFDPAAKKWDALPDLPAARSSHDAVVIGDKIIVVGGWKMNGAGQKSDWHDTALVLDLKKQPLQWQSVQQPFQRRALTAADHAGKVYVIGGMKDGAGLEPTANIYDPAKNEWTMGPTLAGPQRNAFSPAACDLGGRLYVSTADGKVSRLSEKGDNWEEVGALKQARIVHRMVAAGDGLLLALGGAARGGATGNVALTEAFKPPTATKVAKP